MSQQIQQNSAVVLATAPDPVLRVSQNTAVVLAPSAMPAQQLLQAAVIVLWIPPPSGGGGSWFPSGSSFLRSSFYPLGPSIRRLPSFGGG